MSAASLPDARLLQRKCFVHSAIVEHPTRKLILCDHRRVQLHASLWLGEQLLWLEQTLFVKLVKSNVPLSKM